MYRTSCMMVSRIKKGLPGTSASATTRTRRLPTSMPEADLKTFQTIFPRTIVHNNRSRRSFSPEKTNDGSGVYFLVYFSGAGFRIRGRSLSEREAVRVQFFSGPSCRPLACGGSLSLHHQHSALQQLLGKTAV